MLENAVIYLAAAIIAVPIAKRLGLGSVLGYLLAGMLIGPYVLGLVGDQTDVMHFAEFGVVMMLFLVGLELHPSRLWMLRRSIIGLGGLQVVVTAAVFVGGCVFILNLRWETSVAIGLMLALSSTAIVLQTLTEKGWIRQDAGQNAFSVLLFQDIAVIPMLALLPLLAFVDISTVSSSNDSLIAHFPAYAQAAIAVTVIGLIVFTGKYVSRPLFRYIAQTRLRELFTVFALFLVIAIAVIMQKIGLSPALGTFIAGVVLAESEFRHELEADIEPFKGLLLGLFFITVGATIDFPLLYNQFVTVSLLVIGLIVVKAAVLFALGSLFKMKGKQRLLFTLALAQGGEFAFVLLSLTSNLEILTAEQTKLTTLVVAVSMLFAPLLLMLYEYAIHRVPQNTPDFDAPQDIDATNNVIIAGYGRFGQIVGRLLSAQGYHLSILDHNAGQIDLVRGFGNRVLYGDAGRGDLLKAAGAGQAKLLVLALNDPDKILDIVTLVKKYYPNLNIAARAIDRRHAYQLMNLGVHAFRRETFDSAIHLGVEALTLLGNERKEAERSGRVFAEHDIESLNELADLWGDDKSYGVAIKQRLDDLKQVLGNDQRKQDKLKSCDTNKAE